LSLPLEYSMMMPTFLPRKVFDYEDRYSPGSPLRLSFVERPKDFYFVCARTRQFNSGSLFS
jgi:hypothetical protein